VWRPRPPQCCRHRHARGTDARNRGPDRSRTRSTSHWSKRQPCLTGTEVGAISCVEEVNASWRMWTTIWSIVWSGRARGRRPAPDARRPAPGRVRASAAPAKRAEGTCCSPAHIERAAGLFTCVARCPSPAQALTVRPRTWRRPGKRCRLGPGTRKARPRPEGVPVPVERAGPR